MVASSFYFLRHGETDWNFENRITGQTDIPINATGIAQAQAVITFIQDLGIKTICASSLIRARQTAEIINEVLNCSLFITDDFKELCWGEIEGTIRASDGRLQKWEQGLISPEGAETHDAFIARIQKGLQEVLSQPQPVLIISHGNVYWALRKILNITDNMRIPNCMPMYFKAPESDQEKWKIEPLV